MITWTGMLDKFSDVKTAGLEMIIKYPHIFDYAC